MPSLTIIDTVARREDKFPLGCEIVLDIARKLGWHADKTITDKGNAEKIGGLEKDYDILGFSLYHQLQYFNIVPILKSFSLPLLTHDRKKGDPIVCAGGAAVTSNPFPVADFFDFILLGDAEEVFPQILKLYSKADKDLFLRCIAETFDSVLVPKYQRERYKVAIAKDINSGILPPAEGRQPKIELARGCRFNCSFCLQSIIPYRENSLSAIIPILYQYAPKSIFLSANTPASYSEFLPLLDYCKQEKIYPRGLSERLSSLSLPVLEKMRELNMIQANIGIEGYSERLRQIIRKPISKEKLQKKLCLIQRYIPILSVNFISHLPTVDILDVLEFKETMETVLSQRDNEGWKTGYDFTTTPLIARPHTLMELWPCVEEKAESLAEEARIALLDQFTSVKLVATLAIKAGLRSKVYLPLEFETHTSRWNAASKAGLKWVMDRSEVVVVGSGEYSVRRYFRRNERMVDDADLVIAFYDGREDGGVARNEAISCIKYAQHKHKRVFDAFGREEIAALPGENIYDKLDALHDNDNDTIDYFDESTYFSSIFKIDMERHGDGTEGNEAKERELAQVSPFKLKFYFQSADYYISNGIVFERHEELGYRDRDSIACRIKMATKCSGEEARKIAKYLEIVDRERRMEDQWVKWLRINFQKTLNYLELLFYNLAGFEPDAEMESVLDWAEDPEAEAYKPKFVQSWNDDPSEDDWDELEDDGVMVDPSYGWHRLNDPIVYDAPLPKIEDRLSQVALPIYQRIQSLSGNALAGYGKVLYRLWAEWKDGKRNSFKQRDWDELWAAYKYRKSEGKGHERSVELRT